MTPGRARQLVIRTPEGVAFALALAGPIARFLAWLIDTLVTVALILVTVYLLLLLVVVSPSVALALVFLAVFVISFGYGIALEWWWRGRTIGKRVLGLRVVDEQGLRLTFPQVVLRNLLRVADMLPALYLVGGAACAVSRRSQRLGDLAAGTVVIRPPKTPAPEAVRAVAGPFNSFRRHPHLEARLRQRATRDAAEVALRALLRRDQLEPAARVALFGEIADHFRQLVSFPPEATGGLSDEQYVRNVVDSLFRARAGAAK